MRKRGILHPELNEALSLLGHTDTFVVADAGLPIPSGVRRIDLALLPGVPSFTAVLDAILTEIEVEGTTVAAEAQHSPISDVLDQRCPGAERVPHEQFKKLAEHARFVVRTGEVTPYANVIIRCGVPF